MSANSTVVPDRVLRGNVEGENLVAHALLDIPSTTEESSAVDGRAGAAEATLSDVVGSLVEAEFDSVAHLGCGLSGLESQTSISNLDNVVGSGDDAGGESEKSDGRGVHFGGCGGLFGGDGGGGDSWCGGDGYLCRVEMRVCCLMIFR